MQRVAALFFAIFAVPALVCVQAHAQSGVQPGEAPASLQVIIPGEEFVPAAVARTVRRFRQSGVSFRAGR